MIYIATLSLSNPTVNGCDWTISGMGNPFNSTYYMEAGVALNAVGFASPSPPSGRLAWISAPAGYQYNYVSGSLNGLNPSTTYTIYGYARADDALYYPAGSATITTAAPPLAAPWIIELSKGATWITISRGHSDSSVSLATYINGVSLVSSGYSYSTDGNTIYIYNLQPSTSYFFYVMATKDGQAAYSNTIFITTLNNPRPANWEWYIAKASGQPLNVSALEWSDFCSRINTFRTYKGLGSYPFTSVSSGTPIYASYFNQAIQAISAMVSTIPPVSTGGYIYASYLNTLRDNLNSIS